VETVGDGSVAIVVTPRPRTTQRTADGTATADSSDTATVTATPGEGSKFVGWSGSCSGTAPTCTTAADSSKRATANFEPGVSSTIAYALNVTRVGGGVVRSDPPGILCGVDLCQKSWPANQRVTLTASNTPGVTFAGWGGACAGSGTCVVLVPTAEAVTARFEGDDSTCTHAPPLQAAFTLKVLKNPRRVRVVLVPTVAATVRMRLGRSGLLVFDRSVTSQPARTVRTFGVARTFAGGLYRFTMNLSDDCGRSAPPQQRAVRLPRPRR
jgi:hypothetical protein